MLFIMKFLLKERKGKDKMNKLFSKIATLSVGLAMAVGVGVALGHQSVLRARAETTVTSTFTNKDLAVGEGEPEWTASIAANAFETSSPARGVQFGTAKGAFTITSNEQFSGVTSVSMVVSTNGSANSNTIAVKVGTTDFTTGDPAVSSYSMPKANNYDVEFTGAASTGSIVISVNDTNKSVYFKSITIKYSPVTYVVDSLTTNPASDFTIDGENSVSSKSAEVTYSVSYTGTAGQGKVTVDVKEGGAATAGLLATNNYELKKVLLNAKKNGTYTLTITTVDKNSSSVAVSKELIVTVQNLVVAVAPAKLKDPSTLKFGDKIYLVDEEHQRSIGAFNSEKGLFNGTAVTVAAETLADVGEATPLVIGKYDSHLLLKYDNGYVGVESAKTTLSVDGSGTTLTWDIVMEEDFTAVIKSTSGTDNSIQYNFNNGSDRFSNYLTAQTKFAIYYIAATNQEAVNEFEENYMHMSDYTESKGWCSDSEHNYYDFAKEAYKALSSEQKALIEEATLLRLAAWAKANGETFDPSAGTFTKAETLINYGSQSQSTAVIIIIVSTMAITVVGVALILKKKHR